MLQLGHYIRETQEHRASLECEPSDMTKNMAGSQEETDTPVEGGGKNRTQAEDVKKLMEGVRRCSAEEQ